MNEKRFIFATNEKWFLFDNETEDYMDMEDCKDKLNELAEENKQLQKELNDFKPVIFQDVQGTVILYSKGD